MGPFVPQQYYHSYKSLKINYISEKLPRGMNRFSLVLGTGGLLEEGYVDVQNLTASL